MTVGGLTMAWAGVFAWLAVLRHLSGGSHAEDLGFTDQVIWHFLHGQWFRMSIYAGAVWNTELDLAHVLRTDSLLAFHVEPMLLVFVPLYALGGGVELLLVVQAVAVALGALPAFRLGRAWVGTAWGGTAIAAAYLLSPLGQWAVLSDVHTTALAMPLLLVAVERLAVGSTRVGVLAAAVALTAREDVGPVVAGLGLLTAIGLKRVGSGLVLLILGVGWSVACVLVIRAYSGDLSPFGVRYAPIIAHGPEGVAAALSRPADLGYLATLLLSGGWLGLLAPLAWLPALPSLALNLLSSTPWMASGRAHYSELVQPFVTVAAAAGLARAGRLLSRRHAAATPPFPDESNSVHGLRSPSRSEPAAAPQLGSYTSPAVRQTLVRSRGPAALAWLGKHGSPATQPRVSSSAWAAAPPPHAVYGWRTARLLLASGAWPAALLVLGAVVSYARAGAGPLAADYAPATVTEHARLAHAIAAGLPADHAVSASTSLVPHLSHRRRAYVFPAVLDADDVLLDLTATPAPTSAGDVFLRARDLLASGGWSVEQATDGLLLLHRDPSAEPIAVKDLPPALLSFVRGGATPVLATALPSVVRDGPTEVRATGASFVRSTTDDRGTRQAAIAPAPTAGASAPADGVRPKVSTEPEALSAVDQRPEPSERNAPEPPSPVDQRPEPSANAPESPSLLDARLEPSPDAAVEPDGPRGVLRTVWFVGRRFPPGTRLSFELTLRNGEVRSVADLACVWWYPPERWQSGEVLTLDVPDVPVHDFLSWRAVLSGI